MAVGQIGEQDAIDHAEDGRRRSDAEAQDENDDGGQRRNTAQAPETETNLAKNRPHACSPLHRGTVLSPEGPDPDQEAVSQDFNYRASEGSLGTIRAYTGTGSGRAPERRREIPI